MNTYYEEIKKIQRRFHNLKRIDDQHSEELSSKAMQAHLMSIFDPFIKQAMAKEEKLKIQKIQKQKESKQVIYTQSDIAKALARLKPYLQDYDIAPTTEEKEIIENNKYTAQNYKVLSDLVILQNKKLCEYLEASEKLQVVNQELERKKKQEQGWVFQIFYRESTHESDDINKEKFVCMYAILTQIVQIFTSLTFSHHILTIPVNQIKHISYLDNRHYEIIRITLQNSHVIDIGFLEQQQLNLFDRMLFLLKNMGKSTNSRLFQSQLLKNIYSEYS